MEWMLDLVGWEGMDGEVRREGNEAGVLTALFILIEKNGAAHFY